MPAWPFKRHKTMLSDFFPIWNICTGDRDTNVMQPRHCSVQHHITGFFGEEDNSFLQQSDFRIVQFCNSLVFYDWREEKIKRHLIHFLLPFISIPCRCSSAERTVWNCHLNLWEEV